MSIATQNRNNAYFEILETLPKKCQLILELIKENKGITRQELSDKYMIPINEVSGRITELEKMCLISAVGSSKNSTTNKSNTIYVAIKDLNTITNMRNERAQELIDENNSLINDFILLKSTLSKSILNKRIRKNKKELAMVA